MRIAKEWHLYIDESGSFEGDDRSAVVGLLLQHDQPHRLESGLRRTVAALAPELPWPLHATELRRASTLLAAWMNERRTSTIAAELDALAAYANTSKDPALQAFRESLGARKPDPVVRTNADDALAYGRPREFAVLRRRAEEVLSDVAGLCIALRNTLGRDAVVPLAAVSFESQATDRYLVALEELLERALVVLRRPPREAAHQRVTIYAATRSVYVDELRAKVRLRPSDVHRAAQRATALPLWHTASERDHGVQLLAAMPVDFRVAPPVGLVLADFLANAVRFELLRPTRTLSSVQRSLRQRFGLTLEGPAANVRLNTLAMPSPWRTLIHATVNSVAQDRLPPLPLWGRESTGEVCAWLNSLRTAGVLS